MASQRGFALLATLWLLVALSVLGGAALGVAKLGVTTTRNRIALARGEWAGEACLAILEARYARDSLTRAVDTVPLGRGAWCVGTLSDPGARISLNAIEMGPLTALLAELGVGEREALVTALLRREIRGPLVAVEELDSVPGWGPDLRKRVAPFVTVRGTGVINVNAAPPEVLGVLPGFTTEAVSAVLDARAGGAPVTSLEDLGGQLPTDARDALFSAYESLSREIVFSPQTFVATVTGGVAGERTTARTTLMLIPTMGRLAIAQVESE